MADLSTWLRFGPRSKTPVTPRSPVLPDRFSSHDTEEQRRPGPTHMSSYPSLATHASLSPEPQDPASTDLVVNNHDKVWYNPSLEQMVEALQVSIMTNGNLAQLPVHLNSHVLRLIEGFSNCQEELRAKNAALEAVKRMREDAFEDFTVLAEEFHNREGQYKSEIRRLELLLAQKNGLDTVTLARTNSTLDRSQPDARNFVTRLQKRRNEAAARDAEARAAASQPVVSFLHGHSLSTDIEVLRVLDQGKQLEGIGNGDGKPTLRSLSETLNTESDVGISEKFRRLDAVRAGAPRRKPRLRTGYTALEPEDTDSRYLRTILIEQSRLGTGSLTSSSGPTRGIPEATEGQGTPSEKISARIDGNDSDDYSPSERTEFKNDSIRMSMALRNGDDTFITGAVAESTPRPSGDGSTEKRGAAATARIYEQVPQSQATPEQVSKPSPSAARRKTSPCSRQEGSAPRQPRPHLEGRPLTWSRDPGALVNTTPTRTTEDVFAGIRSHDSTGRINTVIRANSSRSSRSAGTLSLAGNSDLQGSPNPRQRLLGPQRRTRAQIAASLAVARDKSRQSSQE
ncbi:hypothetical protein PG993_010074 [Apiospora rasikravindrae]|uniref:Uncharacterized protein n=1 Tax=Apiospora rasikravindrae TaxID=990691 RepID=A0ABR1SLB3_9PEZI